MTITTKSYDVFRYSFCFEIQLSAHTRNSCLNYAFRLCLQQITSIPQFTAICPLLLSTIIAEEDERETKTSKLGWSSISLPCPLPSLAPSAEDLTLLEDEEILWKIPGIPMKRKWRTLIAIVMYWLLRPIVPFEDKSVSDTNRR